MSCPVDVFPIKHKKYTPLEQIVEIYYQTLISLKSSTGKKNVDQPPAIRDSQIPYLSELILLVWFFKIIKTTTFCIFGGVRSTNHVCPLQSWNLFLSKNTNVSFLGYHWYFQTWGDLRMGPPGIPAHPDPSSESIPNVSLWNDWIHTFMWCHRCSIREFHSSWKKERSLFLLLDSRKPS